MTSPLETYLSSFSEPAGYLNFASYGPPSRPVVETVTRLMTAAGEGVPSSGLHSEDARAIAAVSRLSGFDERAITLATSTSLGLFQVAFGLARGEVLVSGDEFPSNLYAWWRAQDAARISVRLLEPAPGADGFGRVTPERIAAALSPETTAVAVSAVDFRTGYRADLAGIRRVIGDRLLVVDGIQGFGAIDADWTVADALLVGGQKWLRAGWGTGFLALSDRAVERLTPLLSGWTGVEGLSRYDGMPHDRLPGARAFSLTNGSPFASGALASALELLESAGIAAVEARIAETVDELLVRLDAAGVAVLSPRERARRAGIVVAGLASGTGAVIQRQLEAVGVTTTLHEPDRLRLAVHATTTPAAIDAALSVLGGTA